MSNGHYYNSYLFLSSVDAYSGPTGHRIIKKIFSCNESNLNDSDLPAADEKVFSFGERTEGK